MWQVYNKTPFSTDRAWVRDRDGAEVWLVAVRCSFDILADGSTAPSMLQDPVVLAPKHFGDPATSSLQYDTDFVLTKTTTDVLLHGTAYAPARTTTLDVSMRVGEIHKVLRVCGSRQYRKALGVIAADPPAPFERMPLSFERSFGGRDADSQMSKERFDERNPIGVGFAAVPGGWAPSVEYPGASKRPAGFGPIPSHWKPRSGYAGTYDAAWQRERCPLYAMDLDDRFFQCAPEDQRSREFLRGGESVELTNLTPAGHLTTTIPRVALGFETAFKDGSRIQHRAQLYSVILEPDVPRVILVWRTSLSCHAKVHALLGTTVWQKHVNGRVWRPRDAHGGQSQ